MCVKIYLLYEIIPQQTENRVDCQFFYIFKHYVIIYNTMLVLPLIFDFSGEIITLTIERTIKMY
jgi:hypothetical protein